MKFVAEGKERLDRFLARMMPNHSRSKIAELIVQTGVVVQSTLIHKPGFELQPGDSVFSEEPPPTPPHNLDPIPMDLDVVFEDDFMLVLNKPRGLAVHPAASSQEPSLVNGLLARKHPLSEEAGSFRPGIVHRLDKETTGLIMVAKSDSVHRDLAEQIREKTAERRYVALAQGRVPHPLFTIQAPIGRHPGIPSLMAVKAGGKIATSHVKLLGNFNEAVLLAVRLETGRTHQIRVHLAYFGLPVLGDKQYAPKPLNQGPLQLHACFLAFTHPETGERISLFAAPPQDFLAHELVERREVEDWNETKALG
ncbi:MAG: RluA family pseudouridine synthase [Fimbriimonadaceae bacterium]|jgi:23S rRNA pseudouridine1911/1915/1917 synthase|nr:RluA family pseudouridine synthase [Fimbriimonadaceae bacterium]